MTVVIAPGQTVGEDPVACAYASDGPGRLTARRLGPDEAPAVAAMVRRCTDESLYRRLLGTHDPVRAIATPVATATPLGRVDIGAYADRDLVGLASLVPGGQGEWEVAMLVEDAWQGHGVGSRLADAVARTARRMGVAGVRICYLGTSSRVSRLVSNRTRDVARPRVGTGLVERLVVPERA